MIAEISWPQGEAVPMDRAIRDLGEAGLTLTADLHPRIQDAQPQVVQVWFEPVSDSVPGGPRTRNPAPIVSIPVSTKLDGSEIRWSALTNRDQLTQVLRQGGRILVRVHCGHLADQQDRPFSASLDGILGTRSPHVPGAVQETWFFVEG